MKKFIIGITGASGAIYALRLLHFLHTIPQLELHLIVTDNAWQVLEYECQISKPKLAQYTNFIHPIDQLSAPPASGSFLHAGMVILPCSMKTLAGIAHGFSDNLLLRCADVTLKERRPLILVPRETPLHAIHLQNMLTLSQIGATILPACPGFYHRPQSLSDLADMLVGKICDQLHIDNALFKRWQ